MDVSKSRLGRVLGVSLQTEIVFLSIFGIIATMFDASLIDFSGNLYKVWQVKMDPSRFSETAELYMKYVLTAIVLIRTFTAHIYLACYILLLYPVLFEEKPVLMLPWVVINAIKCLLTGLISLAAGMFTCAAYNFAKSTCWEFLLAQIVDHAPSVYMFCLVISYYKNLNAVLRVTQEIDPMEIQARRRRTRLMNENQDTTSDSFGDKRDDLISVSTIENVLQHINTQANKGTTRSLDTLLAQMKNDEERDEILNNKDDLESEKGIDAESDRSDSKLLLKSPQISKNILGKLEKYSFIRPSNSKLLLNNWRSSNSIISSMYRFSEESHKTIFANPLFEQWACNVSINAIVPITSVSSMLRPIQSKIDRAKKLALDDIPSETEMRNVFPEEDTGKNAATVYSEPTRKTTELEVQTSGVRHYSWIQNVGGTVSTSKKGIKKQRKEPTNVDRNKINASEIPVLEYYKNYASYRSGYRDDGYTLEFFERVTNSIKNNINTEGVKEGGTSEHSIK